MQILSTPLKHNVENPRISCLKAPTGVSPSHKGALKNKPVDASSDGKFTVLQAAKCFANGALSPITSILKNPVQVGVIMLSGVALAAVVPIAIPIMGVLGLGAGLYQLGKGSYSLVTRYKAGDYDGAENAFSDIGAGTVGTALSVAGLRSSAVIIAEAKAATAAVKAGNTAAEAIVAGKSAAESAKVLSPYQAVKEHLSLVTTGEGRAAVIEGCMPKNMIVNAQSAWIKAKLLWNEAKTNVPKMFRPPSAEEQSSRISNAFKTGGRHQDPELLAMAKKIFDDLGVPESHRPTVYYDELLPTGAGGIYRNADHTIGVSPHIEGSLGKKYLENILRHEAVHAKQDIIRMGLDSDTINDALIARILKGVREGEPNPILKETTVFRAVLGRAPKMTPAIREEVAALLETVLKTGKPVEEGTLSKLIAAHPDFSKLYKGGSTAALKEMQDYFTMQQTRLGILKVRINNKSFPSELREIMAKNPLGTVDEALASVAGIVDTVEGNFNIMGTRDILNQTERNMHYAFSPEEIQARTYPLSKDLEGVSKNIADFVKTTPGSLTPEQHQRISFLAELKARFEGDIKLNELGDSLMKVKAQLDVHPENTALILEKKVLTEQVNRLCAERNRPGMPSTSIQDLADMVIPQEYWLKTLPGGLLPRQGETPATSKESIPETELDVANKKIASATTKLSLLLGGLTVASAVEHYHLIKKLKG
jgi:hypothetical protein